MSYNSNGMAKGGNPDGGGESPFVISELILKFMRGGLSVEEECWLQMWRESSPRNEELFGRCVANSADEKFIESYLADIDYMPYYRECCRLIDEECGNATGMVHDRATGMGTRIGAIWSRRTWRVAAAIMIPLVASALFLLSGGGDLFKGLNLFNGDGLLSSADGITPGSSNAVLVLAGGERVVLGKEGKNLAMNLVNKPENIVIENDTIKYSKTPQREREYNTVIVPRGGEFVIELSDGTKVWLNAESELRYPVSFADGERGVYLTGEAYFEVKRNEQHPFTVTTGDHRVTVLGTEFCVRAYKDEARILTTLESGIVSINSGMESVKLNPGQQSSVEGSAIKVESVDTEIFTAWRDKKYIFREVTLGEMLNTLSRWYNMEVRFENEEFKNYRFTGELMKYSDIREFLIRLESLEKVSFRIDGRQVNVTGYVR